MGVTILIGVFCMATLLALSTAYAFGDAQASAPVLLAVADSPSTPASPSCIESDSGALDIEGVKVKAGNDFWVPIRIQHAPNQVTDFGFEVTYPAQAVEFLGFEPGDLVASFTSFDVHVTVSGRLIAEGFTSQDAIPQGAGGYLLRLKFRVKDGLKDERSSLLLQGLRDLPAGFSSSGACFVYTSPHDVNGDGNVNQDDVREVLGCYFGYGPCTDYCDINKDGIVSPRDAFLIFKKCQETVIQTSQD